MNKCYIIFIGLSCLIGTSSQTMQQQVQQPEQKQWVEPKTDEETPETKPANAAKKKQHGKQGEIAKEESKEEEKEQEKKEDHVRICPTCGDLAERCSADRDRIANGIVLKCGCQKCGGDGSDCWPQAPY